MSTHSTAAPNRGAMTKITTSAATGCDRWNERGPIASADDSCQYANAETMPTAPCAKLKMPVVV